MAGSGVSRVSKGSQARQRSKLRKQDSAEAVEPSVSGVGARDMSRHNAVASSLDSIQVTPRTPRMARGSSMDEVELSLLNEDDRRGAANGFLDGDGMPMSPAGKKPLTANDKRQMVLLSILYLIQGVPLGLALGSVPFLLREHLSYGQLAVFALTSYPYSLKLFWSPIVDATFFPSIGRRKSWIVPIQFIIGCLMMYISVNVQRLMDNAAESIYELTFVFFSLVFFSATQDIAVDGWALTLLSQENVSYASTCQTIGLNTGFFSSFTVFLAFNSEAFANKWGLPVLTLSAYLKFWSLVCWSVTLWLLFVKKEEPAHLSSQEMNVKGVYKTIWDICKLKHVQSLILVHFLAKFGFQATDSVFQLKMVEKGLGREDLAIAVLLDFPLQLIAGWYAAKWSRGNKPLRPWVYSYYPRYFFSVLAPLVIYFFPRPPISMAFFIFLVVTSVLAGFTSTIQFVGISAFHTQISDPLIGGTYMTLLNTFSNLGGTWPKFFVLKGVDFFTVATCNVKEAGADLAIKASECVSEQGKKLCEDINGECVTERDGYYIISAVCVVAGLAVLISFILPTARKLQTIPVQQWRVSSIA